MYRLWQFVMVNCIVIAAATAAGPDVAIRAENFTVPPATGPVTHILARNVGDAECTITVEPEYPAGWQWNPENREIMLAPGEVKRLPFTIEKASFEELNTYPVGITVIKGPDKTKYQQKVVCASAPYFRPEIDGKFDEWSDAIGVTFTSAGGSASSGVESKTVFRTYWSRSHFYLYVQVEEEKLYGYKKDAARVDAVQFALAPRTAVTASDANAEAQRSEFLVVHEGGLFGRDKCFQLIEPGRELSITQRQRSLEKLQLKDAEVVVKRRGEITHYECAIPLAAVPTIRPKVGREIRFSILVHDADGTGIRDWGKAAGLWPEQRSRFAWCKWSPAEWPDDPLYDSKIEFGLCSSKR
jgi:hypothetical protein